MFKGIFKYLGKTLLFISISLLLFGFFVDDLSNNYDDFQNGIDEVVEKSVIEYSKQDENLAQIPEEDILNNFQFNKESFEEPLKELKDYGEKSGLIQTISIFGILIGIGLIFLGTFGIFKTLSASGITIAISSLLSYLFYDRFFISMLNKASQPFIEGQEGLASMVIGDFYSYLIEYVHLSLDKITNLSLILFVIGIAVFLVGFMLKRKGLKKS